MPILPLWMQWPLPDRVTGLTGPGRRVFIKIGRYSSGRRMRPKIPGSPGGRRSVTEMKNLLGIIGSPRKMGNCELMVKEIAAAVPGSPKLRICLFYTSDAADDLLCYR